jgi:anaerobic magnesium-protoporphyrin IX monomethyl ester cyclase
MSDILLGQSYYLRFDPKLWAAQQPYPPLGTLYAASYLRCLGYAPALFDAMLAESEQDWAAAIERERPRFTVIYEDNFNYLSKMCLLRMRQAAFRMIAMARRRGCTVILAGSDANDHAGEYLARGADFVLLGEGEYTLGELIDRLVGRTTVPLEQIPGLAFRPPGEAQPVFTPRRPDIRDLDALPFPAWDLVDVERYRRIWKRRHGYYSMNLVTTRGCPFHCNWCAKPIWGQRYNSRSPQNVAAEVKWLKDTYHPDHLSFADDIFGLKPGWLVSFSACVTQLDARLPFKCLSRVDLLQRPGEVEALQQAGCQTVWLGAESGSQKILDAMEKGTRVEQIYAAARRLQQAGLQVAFFLQFGYPGETRRDIEMTLQMVRDCQPEDIGMSVSYPLPGTKFYAAVQGQLGHKQNWQDSDDLAMLYRGPYSTAFYRQLHVLLHREHRLRKYREELAALRRHPVQFKLKHLKRVALLIYYRLTLPQARAKLDRLERASLAEPRPLVPQLSPAQAAMPSPQNDP